MSERLTERNANGTAKSRMSATCLADAWQNETDILERLCDLEDKIEQGKILELPCAVGDKAYHLTGIDTQRELDLTDIFEGKVCSISKEEDALWIYCRYNNGLTYWYKESDIGRKLFFTREEAEKALAERSENGKS